MTSHKDMFTVYVRNFGVLVVLMTLTVAAYYANFLEPVAFPVALAIAIAKATCIVLFFMHVKYSSNLTKVFAASGFLWFLILISFFLADYIFPEMGSPIVSHEFH